RLGAGGGTLRRGDRVRALRATPAAGGPASAPPWRRGLRDRPQPARHCPRHRPLTLPHRPYPRPPRPRRPRPLPHHRDGLMPRPGHGPAPELPLWHGAESGSYTWPIQGTVGSEWIPAVECARRPWPRARAECRGTRTTLRGHGSPARALLADE